MTTTLPLAEEFVSAADANRQFSRILREVRDGRSFIVTSHGRPVARIMPADSDAHATRGARDELFKRLKSQEVVDIGTWARDELYEDLPKYDG